MARTRTVIMGAAGRDFHDFLVRYKSDESTEIVAFTATQIPGIEGRTFPSEIAGPLYPEGIPIVHERELTALIHERGVERVVFAYSDIAHVDLMHKASLVIAEGADFVLLGADPTMIPSTKPVISVCAVRTGVGKSGISKRVIEGLKRRGLRAVDIRHPMPYRDLLKMRVERYATIEDLDGFGVTVEEREEYEHLVIEGIVVYAGVDYEAILREAEKEADVIIWDGGNNDLPFYKSDLEIVALDPHRPGHERLYYPGESNFLRADVLVINKVNTADPGAVEGLREISGKLNHDAILVETASTITLSDPDAVRGKRALVIEDGPTVTHGGMPYGAGAIAAHDAGAATLVDPRPSAVGSIASTLTAYPHLTEVLPAMGYSAEQLRDLELTIAESDCDVVIVATPIDLSRLISIPHPTVRATYAVTDASEPTLDDIVDAFCQRHQLG
ncbi:MAG: GTPase [Actinobacteria bacterium HGW-Actinobacteria-6]|nr:MAG: GTPase [Actinobacteria bacterium HGW-Actinobacteria-6]